MLHVFGEARLEKQLASAYPPSRLSRSPCQMASGNVPREHNLTATTGTQETNKGDRLGTCQTPLHSIAEHERQPPFTKPPLPPRVCRSGTCCIFYEPRTPGGKPRVRGHQVAESATILPSASRQAASCTAPAWSASRFPSRCSPVPSGSARRSGHGSWRS
jgi:hypothetical protein